jgi:hypothetical protein
MLLNTISVMGEITNVRNVSKKNKNAENVQLNAPYVFMLVSISAKREEKNYT